MNIICEQGKDEFVPQVSADLFNTTYSARITLKHMAGCALAVNGGVYLCLTSDCKSWILIFLGFLVLALDVNRRILCIWYALQFLHFKEVIVILHFRQQCPDILPHKDFWMAIIEKIAELLGQLRSRIAGTSGAGYVSL